MYYQFFKPIFRDIFYNEEKQIHHEKETFHKKCTQSLLSEIR